MTTTKYTVATAMKEVGGLGKPSKMPGFSYSVPAQECKTIKDFLLLVELCIIG